MNNTLIENIKIKSDLQYDILFESHEYQNLDSGTKTFLKECYDMGVNTGIYFHQNEQMLLESMEEGFFDRVKAGVVRTGQGIKNLSGFGTQTADSKDAGVESLLNGFKQKFEKAKQSSGQGSPGIEGLKDKLVRDIKFIDDKTVKDPSPTPDPKRAEAIVVRTPGIPKSLKDKIIQGIRENPGKIKFLLAASSFLAGIVAATASANPLVGKAAGAAINGIGNGILAKIQGRGTGDAVMSGLTQGVAGAALAGAGTATVNAISSYIDQAGEVSPNAFQVTKQKATVPRPSVPGPGPGPGPVPTGLDQVPPGNTMPPDPSAVQGQNIPVTPGTTGTTGVTTPKYIEPGTRAARVAYDADQQSQYYKSRGYTGPKDTLGRPKAMFRENKETMFVKSYNNTYTLNKSLNENIEEKWNESVDYTLDEALNAEQQNAYDEFLTDFGKMFNQPKDQVIPFMQSQGTRFKNVLDYINQNVTPTEDPQQTPPGQVPPGQVPPGITNKNLVKYLTALKASPLFSGNLQQRLITLLDATDNPVKNLEAKAKMDSLKPFLINFSKSISNASVQYRKKVGDPKQVRTSIQSDPEWGTLKEAAADLIALRKQRQDFLTQFNAVIPNLVGVTSELRQTFNRKSPNSIYGKNPQILKSNPLPQIGKATQGNTPTKIYTNISEYTTYTTSGIEGGGNGREQYAQVNQGAAGTGNLTSADIVNAKAMFSKLIELGKLLQKINPANLNNKMILKQLVMLLLDIGDVLVYKKGIKNVNPAIDAILKKNEKYLLQSKTSQEKKDNDKEKSSSDTQKPAEKTADDPKAPNVGWTDPRKSGGDDDRDDYRYEESKYKSFESNNRENKNIFKLR